MDSAILPSGYAAAITKSDTTDLAHNGTYPRALYVADATGGNLVVRLVGADTTSITFVIPANAVVILPVRATRVMAATTVAGGIVALY